MWQSDSQEQKWFNHTKKINYQMEYGCAFDVDTRYQMTDPNWKSFQHPRSNDHLMELCGHSTINCQSVFAAETDVCVTYKDWKKKGLGYVAPNLADFEDDEGKALVQSDTHYSLTCDMYHAAKNTFQQVFASLMRIESFGRGDAFNIFVKILDVFSLNRIEKGPTMANWSTSDEYVKQISLEIAPIALVKFACHSHFHLSL